MLTVLPQIEIPQSPMEQTRYAAGLRFRPYFPRGTLLTATPTRRRINHTRSGFVPMQATCAVGGTKDIRLSRDQFKFLETLQVYPPRGSLLSSHDPLPYQALVFCSAVQPWRPGQPHHLSLPCRGLARHWPRRERFEKQKISRTWRKGRALSRRTS